MMKIIRLALFLGGTNMNAMGGAESKPTPEEQLAKGIANIIMAFESAGNAQAGRENSDTNQGTDTNNSNENLNTSCKNSDQNPDTGEKNSY